MVTYNVLTDQSHLSPHPGAVGGDDFMPMGRDSYVKRRLVAPWGSDTTGDGLSWNTAYATPQAAFADMRTDNSRGHEVYCWMGHPDLTIGNPNLKYADWTDTLGPLMLKTTDKLYGVGWNDNGAGTTFRASSSSWTKGPLCQSYNSPAITDTAYGTTETAISVKYVPEGFRVRLASGSFTATWRGMGGSNETVTVTAYNDSTKTVTVTRSGSPSSHSAESYMVPTDADWLQDLHIEKIQFDGNNVADCIHLYRMGETAHVDWCYLIGAQEYGFLVIGDSAPARLYNTTVMGAGTFNFAFWDSGIYSSNLMSGCSGDTSAGWLEIRGNGHVTVVEPKIEWSGGVGADSLFHMMLHDNNTKQQLIVVGGGEQNDTTKTNVVLIDQTGTAVTAPLAKFKLIGFVAQNRTNWFTDAINAVSLPLNNILITGSDHGYEINHGFVGTVPGRIGGAAAAPIYWYANNATTVKFENSAGQTATITLT